MRKSTMICGCRISQHKGFGVPSSSSSSSSSSSYKFKISPLNKLHPSQPVTTIRKLLIASSSSFSVHTSFRFVSCLRSKIPRELPVLSDSSFRHVMAHSKFSIRGSVLKLDKDVGMCHFLAYSQKEDDRDISSEGLSSIAGGVVALGKFDALHIGHRELAIQASRVGAPFLLSFVGMAEVLGWAPRAPVVAKCDRERVLSSWAPLCGNIAPKEFLIDFAGVRHLTPRQFVEKLSKELGVRGVVAGENYRFGYKAAGDASELVRLCDEYGIQACIINSVMDKNQDMGNLPLSDKKEIGQVSSTRVRYALSKGDMSYVSELLGREHRVILSAENKQEFVGTESRVSAPKSRLLNLPPKEGLYENCSLVVGDDENRFPCRVLIDSTHIHLESDDRYVLGAYKDLPILGIEFRG